MSRKHDIVFLFDVDNTLLDNDNIKRDLGTRVDAETGPGSSETYWINYARCYPAKRYVMVDDKLRVLDAMKQQWGDRLTTVFPRQGHYAFESKHTEGYGPADFTLGQVGALADWDIAKFAATARSQT